MNTDVQATGEVAVGEGVSVTMGVWVTVGEDVVVGVLVAADVGVLVGVDVGSGGQLPKGKHARYGYQFTPVLTGTPLPGPAPDGPLGSFHQSLVASTSGWPLDQLSLVTPK